MKILLIEDEELLHNSIAGFLKENGHIAEGVLTYADAVEKINLYNYDIFLVDINLPDGNGLELVRLIKSKDSGKGIIVISARQSLEDRISGLDLGADDYLVKPFHLAELNARINSINRRLAFKGETVIQISGLHIYPEERRLEINQNQIELTKKEFELLMFFVSNKNRVITKEAIGEHLWGDYMDNADSFDFIYTHIKNLRKKIQSHAGFDPIKTVYGVGYKFEES